MKSFLISSLYIFSMITYGASVKDFFDGKTEIPSPQELRDPFKPPKVKKSKENVIGSGFMRNGVFTNLPNIRSAELREIVIKGVFFGKDRRAIAMRVDSGGNPIDNSVFVIREGMKIGRDEAEIKAILPGGVVVVERIQNVYGQEEYLETIIPISN